MKPLSSKSLLCFGYRDSKGEIKSQKQHMGRYKVRYKHLFFIVNSFDMQGSTILGACIRLSINERGDRLSIKLLVSVDHALIKYQIV